MRHRSCSPIRPSSLRLSVVLLVLAVVSLVPVCVDGAPVSSTDGERVAQAFLRFEAGKSLAYRTAVGVPAGARVKGVTEFRDPESGDLLGYVFTLDPAGYLVVPAETRLVPVIGYSYAGEFPWEESEENILLSMLRFDLRSRMESTTQGLVPPEIPDRNEGLWNAYLGREGEAAVRTSPTVYGSLLKTEWHQGAPYNDLCPWDTTCGGWSVVGCVATALSQILNYWQYPTAVTFTAGDSYTTDTHGFAINAPGASFTGLDYTTGEPSNTDKARLCYAAGVSVRMDYCADGSGTSTYNVAAALAGSWYPGSGVPQRWGYESAELRSCNTDYAWWGAPYYVSEGEFYSTLSDNMADALPAQMAIAGPGGHSIVVDGWQSGGRVYHLNFGWGGASSGWYSLPEGMPAQFTVVKYAVTNIRPPALGNVYAFGSNSYGQLGLGEGAPDRTTPTQIPGLSRVKAVSAGVFHSLVLLENGDVYAFGRNDNGELGLGDTTCRFTPTRIPGLPKAKAIAAGQDCSLVVTENGDVYSFGKNNAGQLGLGDYVTPRLVPNKIPGLSHASAVYAGGSWTCCAGHSFVLLENGDLYAFGRNDQGQLGLGDIPGSLALPAKVTTLSGVIDVSAGGMHSLVVVSNGDVYSFGNNDEGELGLGDYGAGSEALDRHTPTRIPTLSGAKAVAAAGSSESYVLLECGDVYKSGSNCGERRCVTPTWYASIPQGADISSGYPNGLLALSYSGDVYYNKEVLWSTDPLLKIPDLAGATAVSAGLFHALVLVSDRLLPPVVVSVSAGTYSDRIRVSWTGVAGAARYGVHRVGGPHETYVQIAEATGTSYDDTSVTPGQIYWYKVAACNDSGCSDLSAADSGYAGTPTGGTAAVFRATSSGDVRADGGYYGSGLFVGSADVAEWVLVSGAIEAGTVLELDTAHANWYRPSQRSCSTLVAGVVSSQAGMVLGGTEPAEGKALLALSGIVPVKVTSEGGPIQPGDLLVSSSTPGYAMRWAGEEPCPCALVGKALEPMADERAMILVLLTAH